MLTGKEHCLLARAAAERARAQLSIGVGLFTAAMSLPSREKALREALKEARANLVDAIRELEDVEKGLGA